MRAGRRCHCPLRTGLIEQAIDESTTVLLPDGRLLVLEDAVENLDDNAAPGDLILGLSYLYDPATGAFDLIGLQHPYGVSEAIVLRGGRVLIVGDNRTAILYRLS